MRVEGPRGTDGVRKKDKARKSSGAGGAFKSFLDSETSESADVGSTFGVGDVGALIAAQSYEDPAEQKAKGRMMERADKVLDALDDVQRGLVEGSLDTNKMQKVASSIAQQREAVSDPALAEVLDEVELRAQVELAKLEMARTKHK